MPKSRKLLPLALILACAFAFFVWPTMWAYEKLSGRPVRINRLTGKVQYLTLQGWEEAYKASTISATSQNTVSLKPSIPTREQLESVDGQLGFLGIGNSEFSGELYNGSKTPIVGDVIFHVIIKDKKGTELASRRIRQTVNWPPQQAVFVSFRPAWKFDTEKEQFEWHLEPVDYGQPVYTSDGIMVYKITDEEYEVHYDGKTYELKVDLTKRPEWGKPSDFDEMVKAMKIKHDPAKADKQAAYDELKRRKAIEKTTYGVW